MSLQLEEMAMLPVVVAVELLQIPGLGVVGLVVVEVELRVVRQEAYVAMEDLVPEEEEETTVFLPL
jgi:hypothetical protein